MKALIEYKMFSPEELAEMDPAQGRGWSIVKGDERHGMIFFHQGDDSEFVARKEAKGRKKRRP